MIVVPNAEEVRILQARISNEDNSLKLFVNDATITNATVESDLTEMSTHGYAAKTLSSGSWTITSDVNAGSTAVYAKQTFDFTEAAAVIVYGYYIVGSTSGDLKVVEKFDNAQTVSNADDQIKITPKITVD